jgi:hypothetical protein
VSFLNPRCRQGLFVRFLPEVASEVAEYLQAAFMEVEEKDTERRGDPSIAVTGTPTTSKPVRTSSGINVLYATRATSLGDDQREFERYNSGKVRTKVRTKVDEDTDALGWW